MATVRRRVVLVLIYAAAILTGASLWNHLFLPFSNPLDVTGPLVLRHFNPANNVLRFLVFILLPALFLAAALWPKVTRHWVAPAPSRPFSEAETGLAKFALHFLWIYPLLSLLGFLGNNLVRFHLDLFHFGELLTPAWNTLTDGGYWTRSFFAHGVFFDVLECLGAWRLWGARSVGALLLTDKLLWALVPLALVFFLSSVFPFVSKRPTERALFFQFTLAVYFLTGFEFHQTVPRYMVVLLGFGCFFRGVATRRGFWFFISGLFSAACFFYSIDMGAYYSATLAVLGAFLFFTRYRGDRWTAFLVWEILGVAAGWVAFCLYFGGAEIRAFLQNTYLLFRTKELFDGIAFPNPLDANGRHRTSVLGITILVFAFVYRSYFKTHRERLLDFFFLVASILFFRSALGRSDFPHVQYASTFIFLGLAHLIWSSNRAFFASYPKAVLTGLMVMNLFLMIPRKTLWLEIPRFFERVREYLALPDSYFFPEHYKSIAAMREVLRDDPCVFSLTSDAALPYLLRKPACGRFHIVWFASAKPLREELLQTLRTIQPLHVITASPTGNQNFDGVPNERRFPELFEYLNERYQKLPVLEGWQLYRRR